MNTQSGPIFGQYVHFNRSRI